MATSRVSLIVLNWNTYSLTSECLAAIRRHGPPAQDVIVVDNGSEDGSAERLAAGLRSNERLLALPRNLGYAAGVNRGLALAREDRVCLLNSDCVPTKGWLSALNETMTRRGAGLVGPYSNECGGKQRRKSWPARVLPFLRQECPCEELSFFCVLIRKDVLDRIGGMDERFGKGYYEDIDYCRRAAAAGFSLWISGKSWVWHRGQATFRANGLDPKRQLADNAMLYLRKWAG